MCSTMQTQRDAQQLGSSIRMNFLSLGAEGQGGSLPSSYEAEVRVFVTLP